ncbi:MAG: permease [Specibacter sp.]
MPKPWLQAIFFVHDPALAFILGPLIGPLIAVVSFVCSVGNVPLAAVLWNGGISFGGVISFIFADLIIIPIILIYRKYYGTKAALRITAIFYAAMVLAGYIVELIFTPLHLVPTNRHLSIIDAGISWNYTTWLNIAFILIGLALLVVFFRTGSGSMLKMMGGSPDSGHDHTGEDHSNDGHPMDHHPSHQNHAPRTTGPPGPDQS